MLSTAAAPVPARATVRTPPSAIAVACVLHLESNYPSNGPERPRRVMNEVRRASRG